MEEQELPAGWVEVPLAELIDRIEAGKNFRCIERPPLNGEIGVVKVSAVSWGRFREEESKTVPPGIELDQETKICEGDLLFSRANTIELVGACVMVESLTKDLRLSDKILRLVATDDSIKPWIYRYLSSPEARKYLSETSSGNQLSMRNISQRVLLETMVPVAPLNEQCLIAAKLDTTLAAVESCRQRLDGVAELLKRFRQAVLAAATSGELTREWREEANKHSPWQEKKLAELGEFGRGKSRHRPRNDPSLYGGDYPFIQTGDVANAKGDWLTSHSQTYSEFGLSQSKIWPRATLCITIAANIADTALLDYPACFPDSVVGFVADRAQVLPEYAKWMVDTLAEALESFAPATAQKNINLGILDQIVFSVPPLDEQQEIVRRAQDLFTLADQLEARLNTARKVVDRLTPALLAKAFRGELVPQDPSDEPASALLERIQAEAGARKPSRRGRKPAAAHPDQTSLDAAPAPPTLLANLLQECGPLSEKALLAASELEPRKFLRQLQAELKAGAIREELDEGERVLVAP